MAKNAKPKSAKSKKPQPAEPPFGQLCLITPANPEPVAFAVELDAALRAGGVASLILSLEGVDPARRLLIVEKLVPIAQANGVAAIVVDDLALVRATGADGLHVEHGIAALRAAVDAMHPDGIAGAGGIQTRHEAMLLAESDCDYLFFGRLDGDTEPAIFDKALDMAAWWSAVFEVPAIVMGGRSLDSVAEAVEARIEFVALRSAVWDHPDGPAAAVAKANELIAARQPLVSS